MRVMNGARFFGGMIAIAVLAAGVTFHTGIVLAQSQGQSVPPDMSDQGPDPADQNMAPADSAGAPQAGPANEAQQQANQYGQSGSQGGAPIVRQAPSGNNPSNQGYDPNGAALGAELNQDADAGQPVMEADQAPPQLLDYEQPEAPAPDYLWTPGYWGWVSTGYYWVPGVWCAAPYAGALWTPGYWYFYGGRYRFRYGSWGLYVGFYGGINYGYGYYGIGYRGGYWSGPHFYYNTAVTRVNLTRVTYVYHRPQVLTTVASRVAYNGGRGGITVQPRPAEVAALRTARTPAMTAQVQMRQEAARNPEQFYNQNRGNPLVTAATRPVAADHGITAPAPIRGYTPAGSQTGSRPAYQGQPRSQPAPQTQYRPQGQGSTPSSAPRQYPQSQPRSAPAPQSHPQTAPQSAPRG
jgi:pyruvate/2-oxoglutarate dehydrogenase complex dihydrolipoamide acyltransferase (E2) component